MNDFQLKLDKYADLAIKIGVNLQKNQKLVVDAPIEAAGFVRMLTYKAYKAGAKDVYVEWDDDEIDLIKYLNAPIESLKEFPMWKARGYTEMAREGAAFLSIDSPNPDLLKDVDPKRIDIAAKTYSEATEDFMSYIESCKVSWSGVCIPSKEWAKKVFPDPNEKNAVEALWEKIFSVTRINSKEPINAWNVHIDNLKSKLDYLNNKKYKKLHYKSSTTNLKIELPDNHILIGGGVNNEKGTYFIPNIPTEEIFTAPLMSGVNGTVKSTKPLIVRGKSIRNLTLEFKSGRIVNFTADEGYETFKNLIETDEESCYLGEVALVPFNSPISNSNIIFYNTLFDENASCHLALGMAYPMCIKGGEEMSKKELKKNNLNTSLIHVDFMIGSPDLNIDGETIDGKYEPIFRNGNWAF